MTTKKLKKFDINEKIKPGDLIRYEKDTELATRAVSKHCKHTTDTHVIGVCIDVENDEIIVASTGIVNVNVKGIVCIGDKLTISEKPGTAIAIKYDQDETKFRYRSIGKVIGLFNEYSIVKVLLDIE